jgi:hypothetical protein
MTRELFIAGALWLLKPALLLTTAGGWWAIFFWAVLAVGAGIVWAMNGFRQ